MISAFLGGMLLAALGSAHCLGMCGGLIGCASCAHRRTWWPGLAAYNLGRALTYLALGLAVGLLGGALQRVPALEGLQIAVSVFAGLLVIVLGVHLGGWISDPLARFAAPLARLGGLATWLAHCAARRDVAAWLGLGIANGLLPCGLVYAALGLALAQPALPDALALMAGFALGTWPAMLFAPWIVHRVSPRRRRTGMRLASVLVIALGTFTLLRGALPQREHAHHAAHPHAAHADVAAVD
jgi:hypothetical protein